MRLLPRDDVSRSVSFAECVGRATSRRSRAALRQHKTRAAQGDNKQEKAGCARQHACIYILASTGRYCAPNGRPLQHQSATPKIALPAQATHRWAW